MPGRSRRRAAALLAGLLLAAGTPHGTAAAPAARPAPAPRRTRHVVLVTVDGLRIQELFGGLDPTLYGDRKAAGYYDDSDRERLRTLYDRPAPEDRRRVLMPFFWDRLAPQGQVFGNRSRGGRAYPRNPHLYTSPGFAELVAGRPLPDFTETPPRPFPQPTFLDHAQAGLDLGAREIAVFGSWDGFRHLASGRAGAFFANAGYERVPEEVATPRMRLLGDLQFDIMAAYEEGRSDAVTFNLALDYLKTYRPRLLWIALGESDDWAHARRYDRTLDYLRVLDGWLEELWTEVQSSRSTRDRTSLVMTTDHGRGVTREDWVEHGEGIPGSGDIWIAVIGPDTPDRGDAAPHPAVYLSDVAATILDLFGLDARDFDPRMGPAIPGTVVGPPGFEPGTN